MNFKFLVLSLLINAPVIQSMQSVKNFLRFERSPENIKALIETIKNDPKITDFERYSKLSDHYVDLQNALVIYERLDEVESVKNLQYEAQTKAAQIKSTQEKTKKITKRINRLNNKEFNSKFERFNAAIPLFCELITLNPENEDYKSELSDLSRYIKRHTLKAAIKTAQEYNNKEELKALYQELYETSPNDIKKLYYLAQVTKTKQEIEQEKMAQEERAVRLKEIAELSDTIEKLDKKPVTDVESKMKLSSVYEKRAHLWNDAPKHAYDLKKSRELNYLVLAKAQETKNKALEKVILEKLAL